MTKRSASPKVLSVPAIEVRQSRRSKIYTFAVDGKLVSQFADVSRIRRSEPLVLEGYQRHEVTAHIQEIREYIESESPMIPNSIVLAFDSRVKFVPAKTKKAAVKGTTSILGELQIPLGPQGRRGKVGFIVDGQQRVAAVRGAKVAKFPMLAAAFITDDIEFQTEQFILVNATKPLPKGLLYELLPHTRARLPPALHRRRVAAELLETLNHTPSSPLYHMVRTPTSPEGVIRDNSLLKMLSNSLSDGLLHEVAKKSEDDAADVMLELLSSFWSAAKRTFPDAWGIHPSRSRLMHGAGIVAIGNLMDHIGVQYCTNHRGRYPTSTHFCRSLSKIAASCAWCEGSWYFREGRRSWNQLQNTPQDVELLTDHLQYIFDTF